MNIHSPTQTVMMNILRQDARHEETGLPVDAVETIRHISTLPLLELRRALYEVAVVAVGMVTISCEDSGADPRVFVAALMEHGEVPE